MLSADPHELVVVFDTVGYRHLTPGRRSPPGCCACCRWNDRSAGFSGPGSKTARARRGTAASASAPAEAVATAVAGAARPVVGRRSGARAQARRPSGSTDRGPSVDRTDRRWLVVDPDSEVSGKTTESGRISLPDCPELPATCAPIELTEDKCCFRCGVGDLEDRELRAVVVQHRQSKAGDVAERSAVRRSGDQHGTDRRLDSAQIDPDDVGHPRPGGRLPAVRDGSRRVPRLVVEDEIVVTADPSLLGDQQRRDVDIGYPRTGGPGQHGTHRRRSHRQIGALGHRSHADHGAGKHPNGPTDLASQPCKTYIPSCVVGGHGFMCQYLPSNEV